MFQKVSFVSAIALFVSLPPLMAQEMVANPLYKYWANFKPGSTVTRTESTTLTGQEKKLAPDGMDVKEVTYKLVEVTDDSVVVDTIVVEHLFLRTVEQPATRTTFPAKVKKAHLIAAKEAVGADVGEATISLNGESFECKTLTGTIKNGKESVERKLWFSDSVPGGIVKEVTTTKFGNRLDSEVSIELKSYKVAK
ncbi:MAG: hypothetical protein KDA84_15740 [Planctomycetaceae bacterium]|nr:hypothetical protein [Planctomycetaceae bacterium]